jgi:putative membrane protein
MALVGAYTTGVIYFQREVLHEEIKFNNSLHSILGITLGLLLVIRTNTAYDRWYEGRKLIGSMVDNGLSLAIRFEKLIPKQEREARQEIGSLLISYIYAVKDSLRDNPRPTGLSDVGDYMKSHLMQFNNVPNAIVKDIYSALVVATRKNWITSHEYEILDLSLRDLTQTFGGCNRIKTTPMPFAYSLHLKLFIFVYILSLPLGLAKDLDYWAVPAIMIVFYAMVGLEMIGEEIENPFGMDANDIPLDSIFERYSQEVKKHFSDVELV